MDIGNSKKARQSNAGEIVDIVICIRDAMKYSKITKEEVTAAIGDEAYKEFRHLCNKQLPMMEEMRLSRFQAQRRTTKSHMQHLLKPSYELREGDGDVVYYHNLVESLRNSEQGRDSIWSPHKEARGRG
mmetsp:Transcript_15768/g.64412  ORF Transcript_15768/g.64412 Transcript_15768/m.64412 type:complete len:129 (+) Transcript_15768:2396-2782(+)